MSEILATLKDSFEPELFSVVEDALMNPAVGKRYSPISEARVEGYESALADAVRTLKYCGSMNASKLIEALGADKKAVREKRLKETAFPALRAAVPLPL